MKKIKELAYSTLCILGIVRLFSYFNRHRLSILCFHSIAIDDENQFWPGVFLSKTKLIQLLDYLKKSHYQVITLQQAKQHLSGAVKYKYPVVITIDDGWYRSVVDMIPIIQQYHFPATLYVTTYYVTHQIPVVNVFLQYMLWKSKSSEFTIALNGSNCHFSGSIHNMLRQVEQVLDEKTDAEKMQFINSIATSFGLNISRQLDQKIFHNASYEDLREVNQSSLIDVQLHTHRHRSPVEPQKLQEEIEKNRLLLEQHLDCKGKFTDLCYPSGVWHPSQLPVLQSLGIETATTLDEGLNSINDNCLKLKRTLIVGNSSLNHFKLALSGVADGLRYFKKNFSFFRRLFSKQNIKNRVNEHV